MFLFLDNVIFLQNIVEYLAIKFSGFKWVYLNSCLTSLWPDINATSGTDNAISKNLDTASCLKSWNLNSFIFDLFLHLSHASLKHFAEIGNTNSDVCLRLDNNSIAVLVNGICLSSPFLVS